MNGPMYLEENDKQRSCRHMSWEKVEAYDEVYWRCTDCGATADYPEPKDANTIRGGE